MSQLDMEVAQGYRVTAGAAVNLDAVDTRDHAAFDGDKEAGRQALRALRRRLAGLQQLLYAQGTHRLLVVLQARDAGGKDGTIRRVFRGVNPQGVRVTSFKQPTPPESAHDYLWRVHPHVPADGQIAIFNRSHYEDVLVVRVRELLPPARWERRYRHIVEFERMLVDEGTTIVKFFLHVSRAEQARRFRARLDDPRKQWKFRHGDLDDRARWDDYTAAYRAALEATSTREAPWYVVPADRKWLRDLVVAGILVSILEGFAMAYPRPEDELDGVVIPA